MATRSVSARSPVPSEPVRAHFGAFDLDESNARLMREGQPIALAPTPFAVLCALVRQPGTLVSKNALLDEVWGHQFVSESVLKTVISELRTVLDDDARHPRFIETVSRRGYRFIAPTTTMSAEPVARDGVGDTEPVQASAFIGRAEALSRLRDAWDAACGGKRMVVWVAGEPGIGKTALIEHFIAGLGDVVCIHGQCVEQFGSGEPYLPVLEALGELCSGDSEAVALLRTVAPTWLLQLPWLSPAEEREALRRERVGVSPDRMLREMGELLDRYSERRPLLLVTEDLHWSDRATIQLIDYVARRRGSARLMWLASFRLAEVVALDHPLNSVRHELMSHRLCEEIVLDAFSEQEVADYVTRRAPAVAGDEAFVRALHERTDGLPLFVASVMDDILARTSRHDGEDAAGARLASIAVPENLAAIIDHYIAKLENDQRLVLSAGAACGVEFRVSTVAEVLQRDPGWVGQTCEELVREQLWLVAPSVGEGSAGQGVSYAFRHALFRQVLYQRTAPSARAQLHRKIGTALERERAEGVRVGVAELAVHFERGSDPITALRYYAEAAEAALAHLSPGECTSLTESALALLDQVPAGTDRDALEITLATLRGVAVAHVMGLTSLEARDAFDRAYARLGSNRNHPMRGLLLHAFGFVLCLRAEYDAALAVTVRDEPLSDSADNPLLLLSACTVQTDVHLLQGRPRAGREWSQRGLAALEALSSSPQRTFLADPEVTLLGLAAIHLCHLGLLDTARARLQQAHARARVLKQPMAKLVALWCDALLEVRLGNAERVAALADEMRALVEESMLAQGRAVWRWFRGWADSRMGQPREGYRRIRGAYEDNRRLGMRAGGSETLGYAAEALVLAGEWDAAQTQLEEALQIAASQGERVYLPQLLLIEAAISRGRGQSAAAQDSVRRAIEEARAQEAPWLELIALLELCEHDGVTAKDRHALAALVNRLPEAKESAAFQRAQALRDRRKPA